MAPPAPGRKGPRCIPGVRLGPEALARLGLRRVGLPVRTQVVIAGVGRGDLMAGDRQAVEVDSVAHHASPETHRNEPERDLRPTRLGYRVPRPPGTR